MASGGMVGASEIETVPLKISATFERKVNVSLLETEGDEKVSKISFVRSFTDSRMAPSDDL